MFGLTSKEVMITPEAFEYLKEQVKSSSDAVGIKLMILTGKGCSGNEYDMKPLSLENISEDDDVIEYEGGLKLFIPKKDGLRFFGTKIDYITDNLGSSRIVIVNPNETARCGCGESISF